MKVLQISGDYYYSTVYPSFQQAMLNTGVDSSFFVPSTIGVKLYPFDENIIQTPCFQKWDKLYYHHKQTKVFKALMLIIENRHPDIIHSHFLFSGGYCCYMAKKKYGIPYLVAVRNTDMNTFFRYCFWLRPLGVKIMQAASAVVFLSDTYRRQLIGNYVPNKYRKQIESKSIILPNGIHSYWLESRKSHSLKADNNIRVVFAGSIDRNKNCLATSEACKLLLEKGYSVEYTIIGRIVDDSYFRNLTKNEYVHYIPPKNKEELAELYNNQDVFVMPSFHETFGLVYAEAMSQGLPVIYTRGQGFDKQFDEGVVGYSVDATNPVEIAEKLLLIKNDYVAISQRCKYLCEKFDWEKIALQYVDLYRSSIWHNNCS